MRNDMINVLLMAAQVFLCAIGFLRIKKYIFDLCGYLDILFFVFFAVPAWDLYYNLKFFTHRIEDYGVVTSSDEVFQYIVLTTLIMFLFEIGYRLGTGRFNGLSDNRRLVDIDSSVNYVETTYRIAVFLLALLWLTMMYIAYRSFNRSILLFLLPSRKQDTYSSVIGLLQLTIPDVILALSVIHHWNQKKIIQTSIVPIVMVLLSVSSNNQRREMIQGIAFCGLLLLMKYFKVLNEKKGTDEFLRKKPWKKYAVMGVAVAVALIPLLWYARNFSNQMVKGGVTVNPFSVHSFTDLLFGSSSTGFDTTLIIAHYDQSYGGLFFHCIRFFLMFWIPRSLYPSKIMQITQMIKVARGDWGNLSTFFVNDLYFSFKEFSFVFVPAIGILVSKVYNRVSRSKRIEDLVVSVYMFSQIILLFKNGVSVFGVRIVFFVIMFRVVSFVCKHLCIKAK